MGTTGEEFVVDLPAAFAGAIAIAPGAAFAASALIAGAPTMPSGADFSAEAETAVFTGEAAFALPGAVRV